MFARKDPLNPLSKEEITSKLVPPELNQTTSGAWLNGSVIPKITGKERREQDRLIRLVKRYLDYTERKGMLYLIKDKLDDTSLTGLSVANFYASCRNPTEDRLKDAIALYKDLKKEGFLDTTDIGREKGTFMSDLRTTITQYKKNGLAGKIGTEKHQFVNDILDILNNTGDTDRLNKAITLKNKLMKSKSWYLNDVKIMFSKACIICGGLSDNDQLLKLGDVFDNDLKATAFTKIVGVVLTGLEWCTHGFSICLDFMSQAIGNLIENESQCVDRLINEHIKASSKSSASDKEVLQQLYQARQIVKVQQGQQSCYEMYANLHQKNYLSLAPSVLQNDPAKTKIKPAVKLDIDDHLLETFETSDAGTSSVYVNTHTLHDIMSYIKSKYVDKENPDPEIKRLFLALESEFKKIKMESTSTEENSTNFQLGNLKENKPVFETIQKLLGQIKPKLSDLYGTTLKGRINVGAKLEEGISQLKNTVVSSLINQALASNASKYIKSHFDTKKRSLQLPEPSSANKTDEKTSLLGTMGRNMRLY